MNLSFLPSQQGDGGVLHVGDLVVTVRATDADDGRYEVLLEGSAADDAPDVIFATVTAEAGRTVEYVL